MNVIELFEQKRYDELLSKFDEMSPEQFRKELIALENAEQKKGVNVFEVLHDELTGKQWKHFRWLDSSERESEYIMSKSDFSEEDNENLKACDF